MGSTSFPIDRGLTSALLGFDGPMQNSIDCVASRDFVLELASAMAQTANTMSRTALDLYNWSTPEYGYIEVDDSCAVCSSIMPQKKNPFTLEHVKAKATHLEGFLISIFNGMKNVIFSHCRDISVETPRYFWSAMQEREADFALLNVTMKTLSVKPEKMLANARRNFCTVTELANYLVRHDGVSFRETHEIIADVVGNMCERGVTSEDIDAAAIDEVSTRLFGFKTKLTDALVREALDPCRVVNEKSAIGGTAPDEVSRQLDLIERGVAADEILLAQREEGVGEARQALDEAVDALIARNP